ncbi:MAG TPA: TonB-dependent receptor [Bacteroidia bacterium]|nr:TonB-dependent receptor [Bacteroidia bacterium]
MFSADRLRATISVPIRRCLFICIGLILTASAMKGQHGDAPGEGIISGRIMDSLTGTPVEYASISLVQPDTKKEVNGTTTDDKGHFELNHVAAGTYKLVVYFVGYQTGYRNNVVITKDKPVYSLGDFRLRSSANLKTVKIEADKSLVENKIDKMVYNAENDITSQGGVATDILKKVPQVSVDVDGNVELQGNSNIRFLINGKPSSIFGNSLPDVLASIPASQIQSIEVITSPGAKYDAEGTGGIINIILKKSTAQGFNGNVSLSAGTRFENGSLNLNARKGHVGARAFFSGNGQLTSTVTSSSTRTSQDPSLMQSSQLVQNGSGNFDRNGYQTGGGFDWEITPKDNFSAGVTYNYFGVNNTALTNRSSLVYDANGNLLSSTNDQLRNKTNSSGKTFNWNAGYKKEFKKEGQELEATINSSTSTNYSYYQQSQARLPSDSIYSGSSGQNPGQEKETEIAINYAQPFTEDVVLETGAKAVLDQISSTSNVFLLNNNSGNYDYNTSQSSVLSFKRNIYAGYLSMSFKLFDYLNVKAGGRYEYTESQGTFSGVGEVNYKPYGTLVPSLAISHSLGDNQMIKLNYSHRIERPEYRELNPFMNMSDPHNITTGDIYLRPEQADKIELGYSKSFEKGASVNLTLFARLNTDDIQPYTQFFPTYKIGDSVYSNVSITARENIGHENNLGGNLYFSWPITSKITLRSNISCFERYIITGLSSGGDVHGFNYRINMNGTYEISNTLIVEAFGNFNSPRINAQGTMPSFATYTFALRKQFLKKKASIALTATNPFSETVGQKSNLSGSNFTLVSDRQLPYRSFGLNFTYKFGKMEFKKQKEQEDAGPPEPPSGN